MLQEARENRFNANLTLQKIKKKQKNLPCRLPAQRVKGFVRTGLGVSLWQTARFFSGNRGRLGVAPPSLSPYPVLRSDDHAVYALHSSRWTGIRLAVRTAVKEPE